MSVPVHIVSGFLGTGKTTAVKHQLELRGGERIAVIVNDFGEASLDEAALSSSEPFRITNIPGGCVCCTAPEGLVAALGAILEEQPDRVIIEPTGLARPQDLIDMIRRGPHRDSLALRPVVVLVDPRQIDRENASERDAVRHQVGAADVLVANRTDLCSAEELARFDAWAAELWPAPLAIHHTTYGAIPPSLMEWPEGQGPRAEGAAQDPHHHHDSTRGFRAGSWQWPAESWFSRARLLDVLEKLRGGEAGAPLARFKGIFRTREGVLRMELAGGALHEEPSAHRRDSRADAIFEAAGEGDGSLQQAGEWLGAAVLSDAEQSAQAGEIELALWDGREHSADRALLASLPGGLADVSKLFPKRSGAAASVRELWRYFELPEQGEAVVIASDGFASEPVPVTALCQGVLIHSIGGVALSPDTGGPFRLMIPEEVADAPSGCANVKGVVRIVVRAERI